MQNHIINDKKFKKFHIIVDIKIKGSIRLIKIRECKGTYDEIISSGAQVI